MFEKFNTMLGNQGSNSSKSQPPPNPPGQDKPTNHPNPPKTPQVKKLVQLDVGQNTQTLLVNYKPRKEPDKLKMKEDKLPQKKLKGVQKTGSPRSGSKKKEEKNKADEKLGNYMKSWLKNKVDNTRIVDRGLQIPPDMSDPTVPDDYEMGDELRREVPQHVGAGRAGDEHDDQ